MRLTVFALAAPALLAACADEPPVAALNAAQSSITEAQAADAGRLAPTQLSSAERQLAEARILAEDGDQEEALQKAEAARADANAARAQAAEISAQGTAAELAAAEETNEQLAARLAELEAERTARGTVVTLGDVLFETDRASLTAGGLARIGQIAGYLRANPGEAVVIEGHADSRGAASYNQQLSEARAASVAEALLSQGIATPRVVFAGAGENSPIASNATQAGRQLNRRVEVIFVDRV